MNWHDSSKQRMFSENFYMNIYFFSIDNTPPPEVYLLSVFMCFATPDTWATFLYFIFPLFTLVYSFLFISLSLWFVFWRWGQFYMSRYHQVYIELWKNVNHPHVCCAWQLVSPERRILSIDWNQHTVWATDSGRREVHIDSVCINRLGTYHRLGIKWTGTWNLV